MGKLVKINTDSLSQLEKDLKKGVSGLKQCIKELDENVEQLNSTWEGPNKKILEKQYKSVSEDMLDMVKSMNKYNASLKSANKKYKQCASEILTMMKG